MAIGTKHGFIPEEGTVIRATLRTDDLLEAFTEELFLYRPGVTRGIKAEYADVYAWLERGKGEDEILNTFGDAPANIRNAADYLVNELLPDRLGEEGQAYGFYFGAHPGDGSDFGFWRVEEEGV